MWENTTMFLGAKNPQTPRASLRCLFFGAPWVAKMVHSLKLTVRTCQEAGPQKETIIFQKKINFQGRAVSFREGNPMSLQL